MTLHLTLPLPLSLNNAYPTSKSGHRYLTPAGKRWKLAAALLIRTAATAQGFAVTAGDRLALEMTLHFADNRRCDLSNRIKMAEDALAEALGFDDCRVDRLTVARGAVDKAQPRCEVRLAVL